MLNLTHKCKKHTFKNNEFFFSGQVMLETVPMAELARVWESERRGPLLCGQECGWCSRLEGNLAISFTF